MQNFNPLSDQAVQFRENAYLITEVIPQFQFDGISAFTFGITIFIKESNSSSIIYNQNDGFEIGFNDLCLYLKSPFGNFQINNNDINFNLNTWYTISISYDLSVINLYVNGIKAIWFSKETKNQVIPNTQYNIGNNFTGFIKNLYVYNICLSDSEILVNFNNSLCKTDSLVAWFGSSGVNFIDKSKNNIPVSRSSNMAKFCNICSGLDLSQKGYIKSDCSFIDYSYYSLLTKLYLNNNYESNSYTIITNTDKTDKSGFRIYVENIKTDTFNLFCEIHIPEKEPIILKSATTILGQNWVDIGLTSEDGKVELFINGSSVAFINGVDKLWLKGNNTLTIGAGLNNSTPADYMNGYVAYFSEFSKILTSDDFARYMENLPFVLSNSIQSLYYFVDPTPIEKMHDTAFTYEQGACFSVFADMQQISTPTTVSIEIDNEGCKDWDEYTDSEKWSIQEYAGILEPYIVNCGLSAAVQGDWFKTPVIAKYINNSIKQNQAFNNYINLGPKITPSDTRVLLVESTILISAIAIIFSGILKSGSKFGLASLLNGILSAASLELIAEGLCAIAVLAGLALLTAAIIKSLPDRPTPDNPDQLIITLIASNFIVSDDIAESAIDITKDGTKSIREESFQDAVCYVVSNIKKPYIKVKVKCTLSTRPGANVILKGTELSDSLLGNVVSDPFTIALNEIKEIKLYLNDNRLTKDKKKYATPCRTGTGRLNVRVKIYLFKIRNKQYIPYLISQKLHGN